MNGGFTGTSDEGYTPSTPTGTPFPVPDCLAGEHLVTLTTEIVCQPDALSPTGGPDVASIFVGSVLLIVAALTTWAVSWARADYRDRHASDEEVES